MDQLKLLLMTLKQKHDHAVELSQQKARSASDDQAAIMEDLKEENQLFGQQISQLKQSIAKLQKELDDRSNDSDKEALLESRKHAEQLERVIHFLRERSEEGQLELQQLRQDYQSLQTQKQPLPHPPENKSPYDQELARIKQTLIRALRESQELQAHYQAVVEEKIGYIAKYRQAQSMLEKAHDQQASLQLKLDSALSQETLLREQLAEQQQQSVESLSNETTKQQQQAAVIRQREETIFDLQRQVGLLRHEGEKVRDELELVRNTVGGCQEQMHEAESHLARKVKESAELEACNQAQQRQIEELQQILQASKVRIAELHASCEIYEQQQKRMQEQLQEAIKAYESQQAKWEEKYFAVYEKWQNAEGRIKDLEKMEERYKQLQGLFSNVGNFLSVPQEAQVLQELPTEKPLEKPVDKEIPKEAPKPAKPSNLFDSQKPAPRHKQNFLD